MFNSIPIVQNDTTPVPMSDDFNSQLGAAVSAHWAQFAQGKPSWPSYAGGDAAKGVGGYLEIGESGTVGPAEGLLAKKCAWCAPLPLTAQRPLLRCQQTLSVARSSRILSAVGCPCFLRMTRFAFGKDTPEGSFSPEYLGLAYAGPPH